MIAPPISENDPERVAALRTYDLLDTPDEEIFDQITTAAAKACQMPISLISLIDTNRQWFKSRHGLTARETDRRISFCAHAIHQRDIFEIEDAQADPRTAGNPSVTEDPHIRSYAGKPLITPEGYALGTLCVVDTVPRKLTPEQTAAFERLAESATRLIAMRKRHQGAVFAKTVDAVNDGIAIADATVPGCPVVFVNKSFLAMTGFEYHDCVGQPFFFPVAPESAHVFDEARERVCPLTCDVQVLGREGRRIWDRVTFLPYTDMSGKPVSIVMVHRNITVEKELEAERQKTQAMQTTLFSMKHVVLNFMNAVQLFRGGLNLDPTLNPSSLLSLDSALRATQTQLADIERMRAYKEKPTSFGFSLLDTSNPDQRKK